MDWSGWIWPLPVHPTLGPPIVSDGWGSPRIAHGGLPAHVHHGVDIVYARVLAPHAHIPPHESRHTMVPIGTPAIAVAPGRVYSAGKGALGWFVVIDHGPLPYATFYQHLADLAVPLHRHGKRVGGGTPTTVRAGDVLGHLGYDPTDPGGVRHLHFELRAPSSPIDPGDQHHGIMSAWSHSDGNVTTQGASMPTTREDAVAPLASYSVTADYSATHRAVDLQGSPGDAVLAPESGTVYIAAPRDDLRDFLGMGPAFVYLHGQSGAWHTLAQIAAVTHTAGEEYQGDVIDVSTGTKGPMVDLTLGPAFKVQKGEPIGNVGPNGVVHWEVAQADRRRKDDAAGDAANVTALATRSDPLAWLAVKTSTQDDDSTTFSIKIPRGPKASDEGSGVGWLLFGLAIAHEMGWL